MDSKKYRFNHIGIPVEDQLENAKYIPDCDVHILDHKTDQFHIERLHFGDRCQFPDVMKKKAHIAFEVDDIHEAIKGYEVIVEPTKMADGMTIAFIVDKGVPIELLQFDS